MPYDQPNAFALDQDQRRSIEAARLGTPGIREVPVAPALNEGGYRVGAMKPTMSSGRRLGDRSFGYGATQVPPTEFGGLSDIAAGALNRMGKG